MGEIIVRSLFSHTGNSKQEGKPIMANDISERTFIKLSVTGFSILLVSIISFVFSAGLLIFTVQADIRETERELENKVTWSNYERDRIRDSINLTTNRKILMTLQEDMDLIKSKLGLEKKKSGIY